MPCRTLLLYALVAVVPFFVLTIPTWTAPVPPNRPLKVITNSIGMKLVRIPAGTFTMGSPIKERDRSTDEEQHEVVITKSFYLGVYPVTQADYQKVRGSNPSWFATEESVKDKMDTGKFPVEQVTWHDAKKFCEELSSFTKEIEAGRQYRFPTEAEWEYACRARTRTKYNNGDEEDELKKAAWYEANSDRRTHTVGKKKPNAWGLYDMHGNVWQWCSDWYDSDYYDNRLKRNPLGPKDGASRVLRGGAWSSDARLCRTAFRHNSDPGLHSSSIGFRVVCVPLVK